MKEGGKAISTLVSTVRLWGYSSLLLSQVTARQHPDYPYFGVLCVPGIKKSFFLIFF